MVVELVHHGQAFSRWGVVVTSRLRGYGRAIATVAVTVGLVTSFSIPATASSNEDHGSIEIYAPQRETTLVRFSHREPVDFSNGLFIAARHAKFEVHVSRDSYRDPIRADVGTGHGASLPVPPALLRGFSGFKNAIHIHATNKFGTVVADYNMDWCPNSFDRSRLNDLGPADPVYPDDCSGFNPFARGAVWGVESGWAVRLGGFSFFPGAPTTTIPDGYYHVTAHWSSTFASALHLRVTRVAVGVTVTTQAFPPPPGAQSPNARRDSLAVPLVQKPDPSTVPDLVAVPAWGIATSHDQGRDYLNFGATIWDKGPAPMVIEGFRRPNQAIMDAYEYFYRNGERIGRRQVGSMEYDARIGHQHWHFHDFAKYELLDVKQSHPQRSGKASFCLANTDAMDMLVRNAQWRLSFDSLGSVCGQADAIWVREALAVGYGDTYTQSVPGQAFDITTLPNGTYYIRVTANPFGRLAEVSTSNNTSLRKLVIGGPRGKRTVHVPPYQLVDSEHPGL